MKNLSKTLQSLPAVGELINDPALAPLLSSHPRSVVVDHIRRVVDDLRKQAIAGNVKKIDLGSLMDRIAESVRAADRPNLRRVINATGIIVHTNLGRSLLAEEALEAVRLSATQYSNLEYDIDAGKRGFRHDLVQSLLCELTGAEAALVVNNNAGGTLLALNTLANQREVIVSRGELIEIGGSFRIPDLLAQSGAVLVEVGTTNRTHLIDYQKAINDNTALLLKVHTSNYRILGFTKEVTGSELVNLAHEHRLLAVEDLGSGAFLPTESLGLPREPTVMETVKNGLDLVTFSGDKLLGGPQCGIIVGKVELVNACAKNPLHRALRVDKMTLAALEATLRLYRDPESACRKIPTLRMLSADPDTLLRKAKRIARKLKNAIGDQAEIQVIQTTGQVGGGTLPLAELPGPAVAIKPKQISVNALEKALRGMPVPIIIRIENEMAIADPRTILDEDESVFHNEIVEAVASQHAENADGE